MNNVYNFVCLDAMDVLNFKHLQFDGQPLTVVPLDTVIDLNGRPLKSCALLVRGTIEMITQETLTRFFENKRKSGGGVIEDMWFDVAKNIAVVTFAKENGNMQQLLYNFYVQFTLLCVIHNYA